MEKRVGSERRLEEGMNSYEDGLALAGLGDLLMDCYLGCRLASVQMWYSLHGFIASLIPISRP